MSLVTLKNIIFTLSSFVFCYASLAQNLNWIKDTKGKGAHYINSTCFDNSGNIFITGYFDDSTDVDPGPLTYYLYPSQYSDAFISKLDMQGNLLWANHIAGLGYEQGFSVKTNIAGNVYSIGSFQGTVDFDPSLNAYFLTASGDETYILELDGGGNFGWAKKFGGNISSLDLFVDQNSNLYITGTYIGINDFDPGPLTYTMTSSNVATFVLKLDASGNFIWAKSINGDGSTCQGSAISVDQNSNVLIGGRFNFSRDFDPGPGTYSLSATGFWNDDGFILKLDPNGNFVWAKKVGAQYTDAVKDLSVDINGNLYVIGHFDYPSDFDPGPGTFTLTPTGVDVFFLRLNPDGNFVFAKSFGGNGQDAGFAIETSSSGDIFLAGEFRATVDFDPGPGSYSLPSHGGDDSFISKFDSLGNFFWAKTMGGIGYEGVEKISVDINNNLVFCGVYSDTSYFDNQLTTFLVGSWDCYLIKLGPSVSTEIYEISVSKPIIYPSPSDGNFSIEMPEKYLTCNIRITNIIGACVKEVNVSNLKKIEIGFDDPPGVYFVNIKTENDNSAFKIIKE